MSEAPTLAELIGAVVILFGLGLSCWALVDDLWDLVNVYRFGEVGGPRWIAAMEHLNFNGTMLLGWVCFLGVISIAIYLPSRTDTASWLTDLVGWLRIGFAFSVLLAQVHRRVGRIKLQRLPLEAWEQMLTSMFDGLTVEERESMSLRLLRATSAGRALGHTVANESQLAVAFLDEIVNDATMPDDLRARAEESLAALMRMVGQVRVLHAEVKDQQEAPS